MIRMVKFPGGCVIALGLVACARGQGDQHRWSASGPITAGPHSSAPVATSSDSDYSAPQATMKTYLRGLAKADGELLRSCLYARSEGAKKYREDFAAVMAMNRRISIAWEKRFPESKDNRPFVAEEDSSLIAKYQADLAKTNFVIFGDNAQISGSSEIFDSKIQFRRVNNRWLIDLDADPDYAKYPFGHSDTDAFMYLWARSQPTYTQMAQDLEAGKFKSPGEVEKAYEERLAADMERVNKEFDALRKKRGLTEDGN